MNDRLLRLHDGIWVRPSTVVSVMAYDGYTSVVDGTEPAGVEVRARSGAVQLIPARIRCESIDAARALCDRIGRIIAGAEDEGEDDEHE